MKQCNNCKQELEENLFYKVKKGDIKTRPTCKTCDSNLNREYRSTQDYIGVQRASELRKRYGISLEYYDYLWVQQGGVCAICLKKETKTKTRGNGIRDLCVDHDHVTGRVRGLLCDACNVGIGKLKDDHVVLERASRYLQGI